MEHYTKGKPAGPHAYGWQLMTVAAWLAALVSAPAAQAPMPTDFSGWHLPLPAGQWVISRGPCGSGPFHHQCGYYEDHCAIDLTAPAGTTEGVPVLAPQAGHVFFVGTRADSGLAVLIEHADGRVSAMLHLSKIVVTPEQRVAQGQVIAYAGNTGSSGRAHLHFHVQPNTVERNCVPLNGLDDINLPKATATSHNLPWTALTLDNPPADLPAWLPLAQVEPGSLQAPSGLILAPLSRVQLPVALPASETQGMEVLYGGRRLQAVSETPTHQVFVLPLTAPRSAGEHVRVLYLRPSASSPGGAAPRRLTFNLSVRPPPVTTAANDIVYISPTFVGPANYSEHAGAPRLCWSVPAVAGVAPLTFRARVVGPRPADSGWITTTCWQPPALPDGTYYWKVFVRDGVGHMNRTNQRPFVFKIR